MEITIYRNKRNEHKYIEVKRTKCSHFYVKQFIQPGNHIRYYVGSTLKKPQGFWGRWKLANLKELLKDYEKVENQRLT